MDVYEVTGLKKPEIVERIEKYSDLDAFSCLGNTNSRCFLKNKLGTYEAENRVNLKMKANDKIKDEPTKELIKAAIGVQKNAYVQYSNFHVGASFRTKDARIFTGCNVENASFTPTSCAERTALTKAVSEGYNEFVAGAVVAYQEDAFTTPCGVCRQFIMEFASNDIPLYITKSKVGVAKSNDDLVLATSIYNLLPHGFRTYQTKN